MNAIHNSANACNKFQDNIKPRHLCLKGKKVIEMLTSGKILIQLLGVITVRKEEDLNTLIHLYIDGFDEAYLSLVLMFS